MGRFIIWSILLVILVRSLLRLLSGILEGAGYTRNAAPSRSVGLVRDPVCGVFVPRGQALTLGTGSAAKHFCSEKCRRAWQAR
jgi:hypothetical protein